MDPCTRTANAIKIRIIKRKISGLGFCLGNDNEKAIISKLIPGSEAEKCRLVSAGDCITSINSISVENMTFEQIITILDQVPVETPVILLLKGPANCRTRLVTTFSGDGSPKTTRLTEPVSQREPPFDGRTDAPKNGTPLDLVTFNNQLQERLTRIESFIQEVCKNANPTATPVPKKPAVVGIKNNQPNGQDGSAENFITNGRATEDSIRTTVARTLLSGAAQIIPSKTGDNEDEATGKSLLSPGAGKLGARRGSHLEPEIASHLENLRIRSPSPTSLNRKYVKLKNVSDGKTTMDTLYRQSVDNVGCNPHRCTASLMNTAKPQNSQPRSSEEVMLLAKDFIRQYFESIKRLNTPSHESRWLEVESQIKETGCYEFKEQELTFAAKTAWRNSQRCIGRIQWSKLQVFDARFINTPRTMFEALLNHVKYATNRGNIRSAITIFKQRINPEQDYRIWNAQLIRYASYRMDDGSIVGDPASLEFTEVCQKLGWKAPGGRFDVLPIVVSANGQDPELFELPKETVLQVLMKHPDFPKLEELGLRWYGVPAVSGMTFDVGGVFFPAVAFSGWYMSTEIARDFCDVSRYNLIEEIAGVFGLDATKISSLWKDQAFLEINKAILYSFQSAAVTIVDHHSASESFMKHLENEQKLRGGCPADWVWIVPPLGGSLLPVFHQEMLDYRLSPCYDYQEDAWQTHVWKKDKTKSLSRSSTKRKFGFREIARAVKFSAKLMSKALARRIRATIIYATETGKSERYARTLYDVFKYGFDVSVVAADHYDLTHLEHEALLLVVTSTFGNGDPPDNGKEFAGYLHQLVCPDEIFSNKKPQTYARVTRSESKSNGMQKQETLIMDNMMELGGPLGNIRFAVFGLGSSSYPHFCAFAHYVDQALITLGGECILPIHTGDELSGQDQSFKKWAHEVFRTACDVFCLGDDINMADAKAALSQGDNSWARGRYRIRTLTESSADDHQIALSKTHGKNVTTCVLSARSNLQTATSTRQTILVQLESPEDLGYQPGDHIALFAQNDRTMVEGLLERLCIKTSASSPVQMEVLIDVTGMAGATKTWKTLERLPRVPLSDIFSSFLDITTPPSQMFLEHLSSLATEAAEADRLSLLSKSTEEYEAWKKYNWPTLLEVLQEFPSVEMDPTLLLVELPLLQPRFYSISSSPLSNQRRVHATIGIVSYSTKTGNGPVHHGVCSAFLSKLAIDDTIYCYLRSAPTFHLPEKLTVPIYLIGAGTGIAPFRSFWQHFEQMKSATKPIRLDVTLIFGCRNSQLDFIYKSEVEELQKSGVIKRFHLALSREPGIPKTYVQNIIPAVRNELVADIRNDAHVYVCGDVSMAAGVHDAIKEALIARDVTETQATHLLSHMRTCGRYHEDIFGNYNMASGY